LEILLIDKLRRDWCTHLMKLPRYPNSSKMVV
jgi:hypothetical protein